VCWLLADIADSDARVEESEDARDRRQLAVRDRSESRRPAHDSRRQPALSPAESLPKEADTRALALPKEDRRQLADSERYEEERAPDARWLRSESSCVKPGVAAADGCKADADSRRLLRS